MCVVIGIDIGLTGCAARIGPGMPSVVVDLPAVDDGQPRPGRGEQPFQPRRLNGRQILDLLRELAPAGHAALVVFEDVRARPMGNAERHFNSFHSQNSLVLSRGVIQAAIDVAGFDSRAVEPSTWKKFYGLGGADKADSLAKARLLYPALVHDLRLQKHHNRAEALLIAHWALKKLT